MATLADMVEEVLLNMEGFDADLEVVGQLSSNINDTVDTFTLAGGAQPINLFSSGVIEIDDELMYVRLYNPTTGVMSSVIRGWRGTAKATHSSSAIIRRNPRIPRSVIKRAISDTITGVYPRLPAVKTTEFTYLSNKYRYDLPTAAKQVVSVQYQPRAHTAIWLPCKRWQFDATGGSTSLTGAAIDVLDAEVGRPVQVVYHSEPVGLINNSDDFANVSGLPNWTREVIIYGACWRIASFLDAARINTMSADQGLLNQQNPIGTGQNAARYFLGMFETRLAEAEARIQDLYPAPRHYII